MEYWASRMLSNFANAHLVNWVVGSTGYHFFVLVGAVLALGAVEDSLYRMRKVAGVVDHWELCPACQSLSGILRGVALRRTYMTATIRF